MSNLVPFITETATSKWYQQLKPFLLANSRQLSLSQHLKFSWFHFIWSRWYERGRLRWPAERSRPPNLGQHHQDTKSEQAHYQMKACVWQITLACSWPLGLLGWWGCWALWKHEVWHYLTKSKGVNKYMHILLSPETWSHEHPKIHRGL